MVKYIRKKREQKNVFFFKGRDIICIEKRKKNENLFRYIKKKKINFVLNAVKLI